MAEPTDIQFHASIRIDCVHLHPQSRCFNCQSDCQYHTIVHNVPLSLQHCHFWSALGWYSTSTGIMIVSSFRESRPLPWSSTRACPLSCPLLGFTRHAIRWLLCCISSCINDGTTHHRILGWSSSSTRGGTLG